MEQGCGWSQRVCPQKAVATWERRASLPPAQPTLPLVPQYVLLESVGKTGFADWDPKSLLQAPLS